jgi:hypothetical protein
MTSTIFPASMCLSTSGSVMCWGGRITSALASGSCALEAFTSCGSGSSVVLFVVRHHPPPAVGRRSAVVTVRDRPRSSVRCVFRLYA